MLYSVQILKFISHGKHGETYTSNVVYPKVLNWFALYCLFAIIMKLSLIVIW